MIYLNKKSIETFLGSRHIWNSSGGFVTPDLSKKSFMPDTSGSRDYFRSWGLAGCRDGILALIPLEIALSKENTQIIR